jgi:hypothetical protein
MQRIGLEKLFMNKKTLTANKKFAMGNLLVMWLILLISNYTHAADYGVTYQGKIVTDAGRPLVASKVDFTLRILESRSNCLLYSEKQSIDMSSGDGTFYLILGKGTRIDNEHSLAFEKIFDPGAQLPVSLNCPLGYAKQPGDGMRLMAYFNAGTGPQVLRPLDINPTPLSIDTVNVGGVSSSNVLRVSDGTAAPMTAANLTYLTSILAKNGTIISNGVSTRDLTLANTTNNQVMLKAPEGSFSNFSIGLPSSSGTQGQLLSADGSGNLVWSNPQGGGTVLSVTAGTGLSGGTITSVGTIGLADTAVTPGTYGGNGAVPTFTVDAQGRITSASNAGIPNADATNSGLLTTEDWNRFNNMVPLTGGTMTGMLQLPSGGLRIGANQFYMNGNKIGLGTTTPTAILHLGSSVGYPAMKFTATTPITTPEAGSLEYDGTNLLLTDSTGQRTALGFAGQGIGTLIGDVSATGNGTANAIVNSVGGSTANEIRTAERAVNVTATANSTASTLVKRDASGGAAFKAVKIDNVGGNSVTLKSPLALTSYDITWPSAVPGAANSVLLSDTNGTLSWGDISNITGTVDLSSNKVTGVLPIANGGTNSNTALTNNQLMVSDNGAIKEFGAMTDGQVIVGKTGFAPQKVALSGDISIDNTGATTVNSIAGTAVSGVGLATNNVLQNTSGSAIPANSLLITNGTGTGVTGLSTGVNGALVSVGGVLQWQVLTAQLLGLGNVENVAISTWPGSANITTVGTIGSGTWQGSAVGPTYGGTGQTTYATGDMLYGSAPNTLSKLSGNTSTTTKFMAQTGDGTNSAAPVWSTVSKSDVGLGNVENQALSTWTGTNTITTLGTITTGTWNGSTIALDKGGTGATDAATARTNLGAAVAGANGDITSLTATTSITSTDILALASSTDKDITITPGGNGNTIIGGNVGIGSAAPTNKLEVVGTNGTTVKIVDGNQGVNKVLTSDADGVARWADLPTSAPSTAGTAILKGNGSGGFAAAVVNTDYLGITGHTSVTTLGTVTTGTWNATTITSAKGGTGQTSYSLGDILFGNAGGSLSKLTGNTSANKQFLSQTGNTVTSNAPVWSSVSKSDVGLSNVENTALSTWTGTNTITTLGTISTGTWNATTIAVNKGGTGATDPAAARTNLNAAVKGANDDITSLTGANSITSPSALNLESAANQNVNLSPGANGFVNFNSSAMMGTNDPTFNTGAYQTQNRIFAISGDGSGSAQSTGILALGNNRPTPAPDDVAGSIDFISSGNGTGLAQLGARIKSIVKGDGGTNGYGQDIAFYTKGDDAAVISERMRIANNGYVGIGTSSPTAKLEVVGGVGVKPLKIVDGSEGNGKVLTSDATGNATWQAPTIGAPPTSGTSILKGDGLGGFNSAVVGVDYLGASGGPTLTTAGTITTGTWNATAISPAFGGTGITTYNIGDMVYANGTSTFQKIGGNQTNSTMFLSQTGNGSLPGAPVWRGITKTDVGLSNVENTALSTWAGSSNITTLGTITTGTWNGSTIAVNKGGTGATDAGVARTNLGAAASGANGDITSLTATTSITSTAALALNSAANENITLSPGGSGKTVVNSNMGIGTTDPSFGTSLYPLPARVMGVTGDGSDADTSNGVIALANNRPTPAAGDTVGALDFVSVNNGSGAARMGARVKSVLTGAGGSNGFGQDLIFYTKNDDAATATEKVRITQGGKVGIGTNAPGTMLEVVGTSGNTLKIVDGNQGINKHLVSDANGVASWAPIPASAPPTGGSAILKGDGAGGFTNAVANTDYLSITGANSVTTLGTITTGTWNGTKIDPAYGGTGITSYTAGDMVYATGATTLEKMAGNATLTKKFMSQSGSGFLPNAPEWSTVTKADVGLSNVENTALSTWPGSANVSTVGTITSGTWNGTAVGIGYGGTGATDAETARSNLGVAVKGSNNDITALNATTQINSPNALILRSGTDQDITFEPGGVGTTIINSNIAVNTLDPTFSTGLYNSPTQIMSITGKGTASATSNGVLALANNRATPTVGDTVGAVDFISVGNGSGAAQRGARINSILTGSGGGNGFGQDLIFYTKGDNTTSSSERVRITNAGKVGIGTNTPSTMLEVNGGNGTTLKIVDGNQGTNKYLKSDANGVASWATIPSSAPPTSGTAILKGDGAGGTSSAVANTDYLSITGHTSVTTLGTVTTGTWNATTIGTGYGGTGNTTYALGDILFGDASNSLTKLSGNTSATKKFLSQQGTGSGSAAPVWLDVTKTDVGLSNVENTALSTWPGSTNIVSVGTVTSGTWRGTPVEVAYGGTGGTNATSARTALSAAKSGDNSDITGLNTVRSITSDQSLALQSASNQNIVLTPGGAGNTILNGNIGVNNANPAYAFDMVGATMRTTRYSADANPATFILGKARGNAGGAAAAESADVLAQISAQGYDGTSFADGGMIRFKATENFGGAANGTSIELLNKPNGSTTLTSRMFIGQDGKVGFGTTTPAANLEVKGDFRINGTTSGYVGFASQAAAGSTTYTFPTAPTNGYFLSTDATGNLSWSVPTLSTVSGILPVANGGTGAATASANKIFAGPTTGADAAPSYRSLVAADIPAAAGDVSGAYSALAVDKIKGVPLSITTPATGNFLKYDSGNWVNANITASDIASGQVAMANGGTGANLTANNGGIVYTDATKMAILNGTATSGLPLLSGANAAPTWGTVNLSGGNVSLPATGTVSTSAGNLTVRGAADTIVGNDTVTATTSIYGGANGATNMVLNSTGVAVAGNVAVTGNVSATGNISATNFVPTSATVPTNGLYLPAANTVGIASNTTAAARFTATNAMVAGKFGIGSATTAPSYDLGIDGTAARTMGVERNSAGDAGGALTLTAGGAALNSSDKAGGDLILASGVSTGTGSSKISFQTSPAGGAGSSDNAAATRMTILGNGNVGIGTTTPTALLDVKGTMRLSGSTSGYVGLATQAAAGNTTYTLPAAPTANHFLQTDANGQLTWAAPSVSTVTGILPIANGGTGVGSSNQNTVFAGPLSGNGDPTFRMLTAADLPSAAGDVSGGYAALSVDKIKGVSLTMNSLTNGNFLKYNGTDWVNSNLSASDITSGQLAMSRGGTGASITANNGGIVYSDASNLALLNGTATAGLPLVSGASGAPAWSTVSLASGNVTLPAAGTLATASGDLTVKGAADTYIGNNVAGSTTIYGGTGGASNIVVNTTGTTVTGSLYAPNLIPSSNVVPTNGVYLPAANTVGIAANSLAAAKFSSTSANFLGKVSIGPVSTTPVNDLGLDGTAARSIGIERNPDPANGQNLTVVAGGAQTGGTDRAGGDLILSSGVSTGTGSSNIQFKTAAGGGAGSNDRTPATRVTILGSGNVGIGTTSPQSLLDVKGNFRISGSTDGSVVLAAPTSGASATYILPPAPTNGAFLTTDGTGTLSWGSPSLSSVSGVLPIANGGTGAATTTQNYVFAGPPAGGTGAPSYRLLVSSDIPNAAGDVSGNYGSLTVDKIKNVALSITSITSGNFLKYNGTNWVNSNLSASDIASGELALNRGGSGANLTANNGGIVYSNASSLAILNGTATAGLPLISGSNDTPAWSTVSLASGNVTLPNTGTISTSSGDLTVKGAANTNLGNSGVTGTTTVYGGTTGGSRVTLDTTGVTVTGSFYAPNLIPSSSVAPTNGIYLPAANTVGISASSTASAQFTSTTAAFVGKLGIGSLTAPANDLSFAGTAARTIAVERNTSAAAGQGLTINAGGAKSGESNLAGGDLTLSSGISTGNGTSNIYFKTAAAGSSGSSDQAPATRMTILGSGNVGVGTSTPTSPLDVKGEFRISGATSGYVGFAAQAAAGTTTYTLPAAPQAGKFLQTDGNGALTWVTPDLSNAISGTLGVANGGTGASTLTSKGILYGNGTSAVGVTAAGSQYQVLQAGSGGTPEFGALHLDQAAAITGTLPVNNGGTGITTGTQGGMVYFSANNMMASTGAMTQYGLVYGGGTGSAPASTGAMTDGQFIVGKNSSAPQVVTMGGDAIVSNTGTVTVNLTGNTTLKALGLGVSPGAGRIVVTDNSSGATLITADPTSSDYFTQYARLNGRGSSQVFYGATSASGSLYLESTLDATKGNVIINSAGGNVGVGTSSPLSTLDVNGDIRIRATDASSIILRAPTGSGVTYTFPASAPGTATGKFLTANTSGTLSWAEPVGVAPDVASATGTLAVGHGGTGLTSGTSGGIPYFSAASTMASSAELTQYGIVYGGGAGVAPAATAAGTAGQVLVSNATSAPTFTNTVKLDTITNSGANSGNITLNPTATSGAVLISSGTTSTGKTNGALVVTGGVGVSGALYTGGLISSESTISATGALSGGSLTINGSGTLTSGTGTVALNGDTTVAAGKNLSLASGTGTLTQTFTGTTTDAATFTANSLTTGNIIKLSSSSLTSGSLLNMTNTNTSLNTTSGLLSVINNSTSVSGLLAKFQANSTADTGLVIATSGNVGIGTSSPGALLDLGKAGTTSGVLRMAGSTSGNVTLAPASAAGTWTLTLPTSAGTSGQFLQTNGSGVASWVTPNISNSITGTLPVGNGGTGATTLTSNGVLYGNGTSAIGVTAAGAEHSVLRATASGTPSFGAINLASASAVAGTLAVGNGGTGLSTGTQGGIMYFSTSSNISSTSQGTSGHVLASGGAAAPTFTTAVKLGSVTVPSDSTTSFQIRNTGTTSIFNVDTTNSRIGINNTAPTVALDVTGEIKSSSNITAAAFLYSSDRRLKTDIHPIDSPIETIAKLQGVNFKWRDSNKSDMGFIAQEVEAVLPEMVRTDETTGFKSVKYGNIVALAIEGIKSLTNRIDQLFEGLTQNKEAIKKLEASSHQMKSTDSSQNKRLQSLEKENASLKTQVQSQQKMLLEMAERLKKIEAQSTKK